MIQPIRLFPIAIAILILSIGSTASAKVAFDDVGDLIGPKTLVTYFKAASTASKYSMKPATSSKLGTTATSKKQTKGTSYSQKASKTSWKKSKAKVVEFMFLGANEMWMMDDKGAVDVRIAGVGSRHFEWEDRSGDFYVIDSYPYTNNHKPVHGKVYTADGKVGGFVLYHSKVALDPAGGRWLGEAGFIGGAGLRFTLNVAGLVHAQGSCVPGALPVRVEFPGYGYQDASFTQCEESKAPNAQYHLSTLLWDDATGQLWFVSMSAQWSEVGVQMYGDITAMPLLGEGEHLVGKFGLDRPAAPFSD